MAYEKYTIDQFMKAMYNGDRTEMTDEILNQVNAEYVDTAGLYDSDEFQKVAYIHYLNNRINSIKLAIRLQRSFFNNFDVPFIAELKFFKKFGHNIYWDPNYPKKFEEQLKKIEKREERYNDEVENKIEELIKSRLSRVKKEVSEKQSREMFIRNLISLGKIGYNIDKYKTSMEEYSLMIKHQTEENNKFTK